MKKTDTEKASTSGERPKVNVPPAICHTQNIPREVYESLTADALEKAEKEIGQKLK